MSRSHLDRVRIVLVEPQHPGNVGAAARAMKNMGLSQLAIVNAPAYDPERARWMAPGCADLLGAAMIVGSLDEALRGCTRAIASTARHRAGEQAILDEVGVAESLFDEFEATDDGHIAILFGREDHGLDKDDVSRCQDVLRIHTPHHASLNLGQAVLLVCHALFTVERSRGGEATGRMLGGRGGPRPTVAAKRGGQRSERADVAKMDPAAMEMVRLLERVGYTRGAAPGKVLQTARMSLQRAGLSHREVDAMRGMLNRIEWALDNPNVDWEQGKGAKS